MKLIATLTAALAVGGIATMAHASQSDSPAPGSPNPSTTPASSEWIGDAEGDGGHGIDIAKARITRTGDSITIEIAKHGPLDDDTFMVDFDTDPELDGPEYIVDTTTPTREPVLITPRGDIVGAVARGGAGTPEMGVRTLSFPAALIGSPDRVSWAVFQPGSEGTLDRLPDSESRFNTTEL